MPHVEKREVTSFAALHHPQHHVPGTYIALAVQGLWQLVHGGRHQRRRAGDVVVHTVGEQCLLWHNTAHFSVSRVAADSQYATIRAAHA